MTEHDSPVGFEQMRGQQLMGEQIMSEVVKPSVEVTKVTDGLGYGVGTISHSTAEETLDVGQVQRAEAVINSDNILVEVSNDSEGNQIEDDGCGDGREVGVILLGEREINKPSLSRAKVFGGGATMGLAARIGVRGLEADDLNKEFADTMDALDGKLIGYGAHTDEHAHGENCGCGAIDKAPSIIENAIRFKDQIIASIDALGVPLDGLEAVFDKFQAGTY